MMQGLMMDTPLTLTSLMQYSKRVNHASEIVSVTADNPRHRYTLGEAFARTAQLANALVEAGVRPGDRVATMAWNDYRHFELYYAISCVGAVCHMINPRLFPEQIEFILNHAEDRFVFLDPMFVSLLEGIQDSCPYLEGCVVLTDDQNLVESGLKAVKSYESFIAGHASEHDWPELSEEAACGLCYTSGTTGNPKGVLYSHRSTVLHAWTTALPDGMSLSVRDVAMPVVPMFHVNAWGIPYATVLAGTKLVLPGPAMGNAEILHDLIATEGVTVTAGVPTIWMGLLNYLREKNLRLDSLQRVIVGGAACPTSMITEFQDVHDVVCRVAWGMTETSPLGTLNVVRPEMDGMEAADLLKLNARQGRPLFGVELRLLDDEGNEQPWDGEAVGEVNIRGPWVCGQYFKSDSAGSHTDDGWLRTGDVANIDVDGYMQITDRSKDIIKSGGEWISSIDLENTAVGHPGVAEAAVIGMPHPKWSERPLLVIVRAEGEDVLPQEILGFLEGKVAKWWIPDDVVFIDELPHTATGKISKKDLREIYKDYLFPE